MLRFQASFHRDFVQTDILDRRPDDCQATRLCREHVNLIGALAHIDFPGSRSHWWSEYADAWRQGTGKRSRGALHPQRGFAPPLDSVECTWLVIGCQLCQGLLLTRLLPDANEFGLHIASLSSRDGVEDIALLMH